MSTKDAIPVVDIFAGPGGLGEGFGRYRVNGRRTFHSVLSVEKAAHRTLTLRAFYRQFDPGAAPPEYFDWIRGAMTTEELFACRRGQAAARAAQREAWLAELGSRKTPVDAVRAVALLHIREYGYDDRIRSMTVEMLKTAATRRQRITQLSTSGMRISPGRSPE